MTTVRSVTGPSRVSAGLAVVSGLVLLFLGGQAIVGAVVTGVSPDEYVHVLRFDNWLDTGSYVPAFTIVGADSEAGDSTRFVYGAVFSALSHLANVIAGNEPLGDISASGDAYAVRHVVVALIGLTGAGCVGLVVWALTRDRVASLWGAAALMAVPVWTGNAMFNVKDVPVGTGYTLVTLGLVLAAVWASPAARLPRRRLLAVAALCGAGFALAAGTRPAMWVPLLVSLLALGGLAGIRSRSGAAAFRAVVAPAAGYAAAVVVIAALHRDLAATPATWLVESVSGSADYPWEGFTLTAGELLDASPPVWYLPAWLFAGLPILISISAAAGFVWRAIRLPELLGGTGPADGRTAGAVLVALQLLLLPVAAALAGSPAYGGLRQHLYLLPAVAIFAGIGVAGGLSYLRTRGIEGWRMWSAIGAISLALVVPTVEQTRLFPYNYVYVNPLAGLGGVQGRWETEQQFTSSREAFRGVPSDVEPVCPFGLGALPSRFDRSAIVGACSTYLDPYRAELGDQASDSPAGNEIWVVGRQRGGAQPPPYCAERGNVTRTLRGEEIVMSYVLRCAAREPQAATAAGISPRSSR